MHTIVGTPYYVAPEVLDGRYGKECDVWSLGVLMYITLTSCPPFAGDTHGDIFKAIKRGKYNVTDGPWKEISKEAKDLLSKMLVVLPAKRYKID
jgi:calcium-dependent protein kinase